MKTVNFAAAAVGSVYADLSINEVNQWEAYIVARPEWAALLQAEIGVERAKRILTEDPATAVTALLSAQAAVRVLASAWVASTLNARTA